MIKNNTITLPSKYSLCENVDQQLIFVHPKKNKTLFRITKSVRKKLLVNVRVKTRVEYLRLHSLKEYLKNSRYNI